MNRAFGKILGLGMLLMSLFTAASAAQNDGGEPQKRGRRHLFLVETNIFQPSSRTMRDLYSGGAGFGGELNFRIWKSIRAWTGGNIHTGKGSLPVTGDGTKIRLSIIQGGLLIKPLSGSVSPYLGAGAEIFFYRETNSIGTAEGNQLGWTGRAGLHLHPADFLLLDLGAAFSSCKVHPQRIEADLGGWHFRLGLGFAF